MCENSSNQCLVRCFARGTTEVSGAVRGTDNLVAHALSLCGSRAVALPSKFCVSSNQCLMRWVLFVQGYD